jgi:hypothetical protein
MKNGGKVLSVFDAIFSGSGVKVIKETLDDYGQPVKGRFVARNGAADYVIPTDLIGKELYKTEYVMYAKGMETVATDGKALVKAYEPIFNRSFRHFSSHAQAPSSHIEAYDAVVINKSKNAIYFSHPIFEIYNKKGPKWIKSMLHDAIKLLLKDNLISHDGPSTLFTGMNVQKDKKRYILHLLHYIPERRCTDFDLIEDVIPLYRIKINLNLPKTIKSITVVPENKPVKFTGKGGKAKFTLDKLEGHCMLCIEYED